MHGHEYVEVAKQYAQEAVKDRRRKEHGKYEIAACRRFLNDLKRAKRKDCAFYFDEEQAANPCDFIEKLPHVQGVWETPTLMLDPFQVFFVVNLFGFRQRDTGARRFTSALMLIGRKNAKSTLAAAILLYCFCCEKEPGAQVRTAATTFDQAAIIFDIAKQMCEKTPALRSHFGIELFAKSISRAQTFSNFQPIHAKASTQDGLNPSHVSCDEIHAHKHVDLLNVLTSAAGAREAPLFLYTTTEGYINAGPWADLRLFAKKLLDGVFGNEPDHFLAVLYLIDPKDKEFDAKKWVKANPLMRSNPKLAEAIRKEAIEAKQMPTKMAEFRIKRLNRVSAQAEGWIDIPKFQKCEVEFDESILLGVPCWGGLDLAQTRDLTVFRLVWLIDGVYYTKGWRWVPEAAVAYRTERGTVPYAGWIEKGYMKQTPGEVTDYEIMQKDIVELSKIYRIQKVGYDRYNAHSVVAACEAAGMRMDEFIQGTRSYHGPLQKLEIAYLSKRLRYNADPVLVWNASNMIIRYDNGMRMAPDKRRAADKIDDMAALTMAIGVLDEKYMSASTYLKNPIISGRRR